MKKRKNTHSILMRISIIMLVFSSCAPAYIPNVVNTPMLSNKGETQIAVYTSTSGFDPQAAYGVTDNLAVMVNGSFANRTDSNYHKHSFVELGGGYYEKLGDLGRVEFFGGFGFGNIKADYENNLWSSFTAVDNTRLFLQPGIGITSEFIDLSFASRAVYVRLMGGNKTGDGFFIEPVLTGKLGYRYVKGVMQLGFSVPLGRELEFEYQPILFSLGLQVDIGRKYD